MTKCIQFNVNGKQFKFDNINVSDKDLSSVRNIFSKLSSIVSHRGLFAELLQELEHGDEESKEPYSYSNISEYTDNIVGELTVRNIASAQKHSGIKNEQILKLVRLLGSTSDEQIIKLTNSNDRPKILIGNNRSIILAKESALSDNTLSTYLGYLFLDKQAVRHETSTYTLLNLAFQELLAEESLLGDNNPVKKIIEELKPLDTVNRNKRLLAYTYNNIANSSVLSRLATQLNFEINKALQLSAPTTFLNSPYKVNALLTQLADRIDRNKNAIVKLENDDKYGVSVTVEEIFSIYKDLLKNQNTYTYNDVFELCKQLDEDIFNEVFKNKYDRDTVKFANFLEKYLAKQEKYQDIVYDKNLFKFNASQAMHILKNISIYGDKLTAENKSTNENFKGIDLFDIILQYLNKVEIKNIDNIENFISSIDVEFDTSLFVKPKREIKITTSKKPRGLSLISTKTGTIKIAKGKNNALSTYVDSSLYDRPDLFEALHQASIYYIYINGYGDDSVRFAMNAINNGFNVYVLADEDFKSEKNGEPNTYSQFAKRFSMIQVDESLNNPVYKFYNADSYGKYAFTEKSKSQGVLDYEKEHGIELGYFDLFKEGIISTLPVSNSNLALAQRQVGDVITIHDSYSKNNAVRKKITKITRINGGLQQSNQMNVIGSSYLKDNHQYVIVRVKKEKNKATQFVLYDINELSGNDSSIDGTTIVISEQELNSLNKDGDRTYKYIGNRQQLNGNINIANNYIISCDRVNADGLYIVNFVRFNKNSFASTYDKTLDELSDDCGMNKLYLFNTIIGDRNIGDFSFVELANVEDDLHDNISHEERYNGLDFARLLASRIGTKINFITGDQMYAMGFNPEANGLVFNGEIYLNTDKKRLNPTTVFHELSHLILAYMKNNNYEGYSKCLNIVRGNFNQEIQELIQRFPQLSYADACEEKLAEYIGQRFSEVFNAEKDSKYVKDALESKAAYDIIARSVYDMLGDEFGDIRTIMMSTISDLVKANDEFSELNDSLFPRKKYVTEDITSSIMARLEMNSNDDVNKLTKECD